MGKYTERYKLIKPSEEDYYNINDFNSNNDIIDGVLGNLQDEITNESNRINVLENNKSNKNLLINSNLKVNALINQRKKTSYSGSWVRCIDMFECFAVDSGHSVNIDNEYLRLTTANGVYTCIRQKIEKINAGMLTASVKFKATAGEKITFSIKPSITFKQVTATGDWQTISITGELLSDRTDLNVDLWFYKVVGNGICDIEYIKLEYGEVATRFEDDDPHTKLAKCQRYLQSVAIQQSPVVADGGNQIFLPFDLRTQMRLDTVVGTLTSLMCIHGVTTASHQSIGVIGDVFYIRTDLSTLEFTSTNTLFTATRGNMYIINASDILGNYGSFPTTLLLSAEL